MPVFYCQPYYQVLLSWDKRLFYSSLNTKSWQMTIECPKNSLCRSNSDPLISLYEIGDQSEISVVFSLLLSVRFWMMNEELLCSVIAQPILHSSFFILHFPYLCGKQLKRRSLWNHFGERRWRYWKLSVEFLFGTPGQTVPWKTMKGETIKE